MEVYSSNSFKSKEEEQTKEQPRVEKLVTAKHKERSKLAKLFIAEDAKDIGGYLVTDVIVPAIKKAIVDMVTEGVNRLFGTNIKASTTASKYSYKAYYDDKERTKARTYSSKDANGYDYEALLYSTRGEAETVLNAMEDIIDLYEYVRVGDLYDLSDVTPASTAYKYGWTDIRQASVERVKDGYVIRLPKAQPLD